MARVWEKQAAPGECFVTVENSGGDSLRISKVPAGKWGQYPDTLSGLDCLRSNVCGCALPTAAVHEGLKWLLPVFFPATYPLSLGFVGSLKSSDISQAERTRPSHCLLSRI